MWRGDIPRQRHSLLGSGIRFNNRKTIYVVSPSTGFFQSANRHVTDMQAPRVLLNFCRLVNQSIYPAAQKMFYNYSYLWKIIKKLWQQD